MRKRFEAAIYLICFFLGPLLFYTDLTRNPYITQICLLNVSLLGLAALSWGWPLARGEALSFRKTAAGPPLLAWAAACALSWAVSWGFHKPFFRPSISSEGAKNFLFLLANAVIPFFAGAKIARSSIERGEGKGNDVPLLGWTVLMFGWPLLWLLFPSLRTPPGAPRDVVSRVWDGYGALVWASGLAGAFFLCRRRSARDFLHLAMASGVIASIYAVCQYFNWEIIWPHTLNPYGGRSVSTFGNPNFLSSFNVVLFPIAWAFYLESAGWRRGVYAAVLLFLEAALLCTLTRSSWGGALAAAGVLAFSRRARALLRESPRPNGLLLGLMAFLVLIWPHNSVARYAPSVLGRLGELRNLAFARSPYAPLHQRELIWDCAWQMGARNPLTGNGFGLFELFYPFYQGPLINALEFFRTLRTHANNAHNEILEAFSQTGLLGLGVFLWLWAAFFAAARPAFRNGSREGLLPAAAAAGVAGMLADNLLNVSLHFAVPALLFWWTAGLCAGWTGMGERRILLPRSWARAAGILGVSLAAFCSWYWARVWMREVHYFAGFKLVRQGHLAQAVSELELSRAWGPREVNALYELGNAYARSGRYADAAAGYREALTANAGYDEIYFNLGAVEQSHLDMKARALEDLSVSWLINPLSRPTLNLLSNIYLRDPGRYGGAGLSLLKNACHLYPREADYWNNLGYLNTYLGRYPQAESAYERALELNPNLAIAQRNLLILARREGKGAPPVLKGLEKLGRLGRLIMKGAPDAQVFALAQETERALPGFPQPRLILARLWLDRGLPRRALDVLGPVLESARADAGTLAKAHLLCAEARLRLGEGLSARAQYREALALDPLSRKAFPALQAMGLPGP